MLKFPIGLGKTAKNRLKKEPKKTPNNARRPNFWPFSGKICHFWTRWSPKSRPRFPDSGGFSASQVGCRGQVGFHWLTCLIPWNILPRRMKVEAACCRFVWACCSGARRCPEPPTKEGRLWSRRATGKQQLRGSEEAPHQGGVLRSPVGSTKSIPSWRSNAGRSLSDPAQGSDRAKTWCS